MYDVKINSRENLFSFVSVHQRIIYFSYEKISKTFVKVFSKATAEKLLPIKVRKLTAKDKTEKSKK